MIRVPFSRTISSIVQSNMRKRQLLCSLAVSNYAFSPYRFNQILGETQDWLVNYLPVDIRGKTVLDVGAGEGETARFFLAHGAAKVIAVEPEPTAYKYLAVNALNHPQIKPVQSAFKVGMAWQFQPDFIKVDIEGYEEILLYVKLPCPAVVEVHGLQLRDRFAAAGWQISYNNDEFLRRGFGCVCYANWRPN